MPSDPAQLGALGHQAPAPRNRHQLSPAERTIPGQAKVPAPACRFRCRLLLMLLASLTAVPTAAGLTNGLALTPPMGWNSWNRFGCNINEILIRQIADAMATNGMREAGYEYVNIDDCWQISRDAQGAIVADPARFPSGISNLAAYVHARGLKLGVYSDHGTSTCAGRPGSYGYEFIDANTYAAWGVDYLKYDNCNWAPGSNPQVDYTNMKNALLGCGRPIVYSLCAWSYQWWMPACGNLWRTTGDITDTWSSMGANLDQNDGSSAVAGPGRWSDPDMLEVGNGGMTDTEYRAHFTLWCVVAAPLLAGNDLRTMTPATLAILTAPEVIAVDQDPAGAQGTRVATVAAVGGNLEIWSKPLGYDHTTKAVALFNRSPNPAGLRVNWSDIGLSGPATRPGPSRSWPTATGGRRDVLTLVVTEANDNKDYDHADWASARMVGELRRDIAQPHVSAMKSLLNDFRTELSQTVLNFLWSAWSQVGVMGGAAPSRPRVVDPEPLLLLTWACARHDPRGFDEVLDWLVQNGRWINVVRLTTLLDHDQGCPTALAGAVAAFMSERDKTPKWRNLAERCRPKAGLAAQPLFQRQGKPLSPIEGEVDKTFAPYGWLRSPIWLRGQSQRLPAWTSASLVLKCRALFGVNIRADAFASLVARGPATASALGRELGYSQRRVQEALTDMQLAGQFQTRLDGNRKQYSIDSAKGWQLLFEATTERAAWFEWRPFGRAISTIWNTAFTLKEQGLTAYLFETEIGKALEAAMGDFTAAGLALSARPTAREFLEKLKRL